MKKRQSANKASTQQIDLVNVVELNTISSPKNTLEPYSLAQGSTILEIETRRERTRTIKDYNKQRDEIMALIYELAEDN